MQEERTRCWDKEKNQFGKTNEITKAAFHFRIDIDTDYLLMKTTSALTVENELKSLDTATFTYKTDANMNLFSTQISTQYRIHRLLWLLNSSWEPLDMVCLSKLEMQIPNEKEKTARHMVHFEAISPSNYRRCRHYPHSRINFPVANRGIPGFGKCLHCNISWLRHSRHESFLSIIPVSTCAMIWEIHTCSKNGNDHIHCLWLTCVRRVNAINFYFDPTDEAVDTYQENRHQQCILPNFTTHPLGPTLVSWLLGQPQFISSSTQHERTLSAERRGPHVPGPLFKAKFSPTPSTFPIKPPLSPHILSTLFAPLCFAWFARWDEDHVNGT